MLNLKSKELTSVHLKQIAVLTMLLDHIGAGILLFFITNTSFQKTSYYNETLYIYTCLRNIGRIAFPIYCLMIVEGFHHTKNLLKYFLRLLLLAIISEIPFDLLFNKSWFSISDNNVFWTYLLALLALYIIKNIQQRRWKILEPKLVNYSLIIATVSFFMVLCKMLHCDYGMSGIACIAVMYLTYDKSKNNTLIPLITGTFMLIAFWGQSEFYAVLSVPFGLLYKGAKGKESKKLRTFFYLFYPSHIIMLAIFYLIIKNYLGVL